MGIVVNMKTVENTVCELNDCSGCNACVNICPKKAIVIMDSIESYNAVINIDSVSIVAHAIRLALTMDKHMPMYWAQGWAEDGIRKNSSSGGVASAIIKRFIEDGGFVASCLFENR